MTNCIDFLPISKADMLERDWHYYDFLVVSGDAYVDHPSFGTTIIARLLEHEGYRVAILSQPNWKNTEDFLAMGKPRYGVFIGGGNIDSMVCHYTVGKKRRHDDAYTPGGKGGQRPDRATIVYSNRVREAFGDVPIIIGGLEASLRRFAHYDYWDNKVRRSILLDAQADILTYGMGERATKEMAKMLSKKSSVAELSSIRGICYLTKSLEDCAFAYEEVASFDEVVRDKVSYAKANWIEYAEHDAVRGKAVIQPHGREFLVCNPPQMPLSTKEMDEVAALPYMRTYHPSYEAQGGVPAIEEVQFSVTHNRGCFGACKFCSLAFHQGRMISCRSHESVVDEVKAITKMPNFKGYIHDVGGPTANFRQTSCKKQLKHGLCRNRDCLVPSPCKNLDADHSDYLQLLRKLRNVDGVKKVFVRSGIRYDYMMEDKNGEFFTELVKYHVSGQLKVAPEHGVDHVLDCMGKPHKDVYEKFQAKYQKLNQKAGKDQYLVPYLMSSHPSCGLNDAIALAEWLNETGRQPEQVQDFYPTPGTLSTCMYYTGLDPQTLEPVYVPKSYEDKEMQRALLQWRRPEKRELVRKALYKAGRSDLIGYGPNCLLRPVRHSKTKDEEVKDSGTTKGRGKIHGNIKTTAPKARDVRGKNMEKAKSIEGQNKGASKGKSTGNSLHKNKIKAKRDSQPRRIRG